MKRKLLVLVAALAVIVAVFGLKVWHAVGVCAELHGRWADGECYFDEPLHAVNHGDEAPVKTGPLDIVSRAAT